MNNWTPRSRLDNNTPSGLGIVVVSGLQAESKLLMALLPPLQSPGSNVCIACLSIWNIACKSWSLDSDQSLRSYAVHEQACKAEE